MKLQEVVCKAGHHGGGSSMVERPTVDRVVMGSTPILYPSLSVRLVVGHAALDRVTVVRIHDRQP